MTDLPLWEYAGSVVLSEDLSLLESGLHAGRVAAAERGYQGEPESIEVDEVMLSPDGDKLLSETEAADGAFAPTHLRYVMTWSPEDGEAAEARQT